MTQKQKDKKLIQLQNRLEKLEERYLKTCERENEKVRNLGWGAGMRGYKRMASLNLNKSGEIYQKIKEVKEEIKTVKE